MSAQSHESTVHSRKVDESSDQKGLSLLLPFFVYTSEGFDEPAYMCRCVSVFGVL